MFTTYVCGITDIAIQCDGETDVTLNGFSHQVGVPKLAKTCEEEMLEEMAVKRAPKK